MSLAVAGRYAQALADVVLEAGSGLTPQDAAGQLRALEEIFAASPDLRSVMLNPVVPAAGKRAVLTRISDPIGIHGLMRNFIYVLIDRRRIGLIKEVRQGFEDLMDEQMGVVRANITSANELDGGKRTGFSEALAGMTGKQVRCEHAVDAELLGGAVVQIRSTVYDGSINGQLEALRKRLVK